MAQILGCDLITVRGMGMLVISAELLMLRYNLGQFVYYLLYMQQAQLALSFKVPKNELKMQKMHTEKEMLH